VDEFFTRDPVWTAEQKAHIAMDIEQFAPEAWSSVAPAIAYDGAELVVLGNNTYVRYLDLAPYLPPEIEPGGRWVDLRTLVGVPQ
jgi:hypothetical protein